MDVEVIRRRFTAYEFFRMVQVGVLTEDDRVELLDGEIVEMSPPNPPHQACVAALTRLLVLGVASRALVWPQNSVRLSAYSVPQPDVACLKPRAVSYRDAPVEAADVLLLVEVSGTSLRRDCELKLPLYARAGIPEVWIADVREQRVEAYRSPGPGGYASVRHLGRGESVSPAAFPDLIIPVDEIFA